MASNPAGLDRKQVLGWGKGALAGGFPHRTQRGRAMMAAMD
jgi:hypothetical protein